MRLRFPRIPKKDYTKWHSHFAWWPVRIGRTLVWGEWIYRRRVETDFISIDVAGRISKSTWEYRLPETMTPLG